MCGVRDRCGVAARGALTNAPRAEARAHADGAARRGAGAGRRHTAGPSRPPCARACVLSLTWLDRASEGSEPGAGPAGPTQLPSTLVSRSPPRQMRMLLYKPAAMAAVVALRSNVNHSGSHALDWPEGGGREVGAACGAACGACAWRARAAVVVRGVRAGQWLIAIYLHRRKHRRT